MLFEIYYFQSIHENIKKMAVIKILATFQTQGNNYVVQYASR